MPMLLYRLRLKKAGPIEEVIIEAHSLREAQEVADMYCAGISARAISVAPMVVAGPYILETGATVLEGNLIVVDQPASTTTPAAPKKKQ